jgi:O-antigen ligase
LVVLPILTAVLVITGLLIGRGSLVRPIMGIGVLLSVWIAWRWPLVSSTLVLLSVGAYALFQMTPSFVAEPYYVGGVDFDDVVLVGMFAVSLMRLLSFDSRRRLGRLLAPVAALTLWLLLETARNTRELGLSALGELRFRYLLLAVPLLLAVGLKRVSLQRAMATFVTVAVALPIVLSPLVLYLKGWSVGPADRLYPSHVSFGLFLGLTVLWCCRSWVAWPRPVLYVSTVLGAAEITMDAHRSVWVAAIATVSVLWLRRAGFHITTRRLAILAGSAVVVVLLTVFTPLNVWAVVSERGAAALTLEDTANWRASVWKASLQYFYDSPLTGRGLGHYWETYVPDFGRIVTIFPHSLYVMVLVHLGLLGILLFLWLGFATWRAFVKPMQPLMPGQSPQMVGELARTGSATLAGAAAYCVSYGLEPYSLMLLGICLAGVLSSRVARVKQPLNGSG